MFLLAQVLINVRSCRTKVCPKEIQEDVACNKILKPFCMQFRKDEAKPEGGRKAEIRRAKAESRCGGGTRLSLAVAPGSRSGRTKFLFGFRPSAFGLRVLTAVLWLLAPVLALPAASR